MNGRQIGLFATYLVGVVSGNWWLFASGLMGEEQARRQRREYRRQRSAFNDAQRDRLEMVDIQPSAPRTLCLGRVRHVEGIRRRWSSGVHKEVATLIVSFAGHEIDGYEQWYLDDLPVTLDEDGYVQESSLGTGVGYTTNTTGYAIGATSIGLITGTGTIIAGDTVRFFGDGTYYTVGTGITAPGTLVLAGTGLQKAIPASATAVEVVKSPYARPTRAQLGTAPASYSGSSIDITLTEPALAGSIIVMAFSTAGGEDPTTTLIESTHYTVSGLTVTVTSTPYATANVVVTWTSAQSIKAVRIRPYLGTDAQNVGGDIAAEYPGFITSADKFAGIALAVVDFIYNPDAFPQSFPSVVPVFRGAKCYDPRLDSTYPGGSGSHRLATPSTWAFTENPALHLQRYITWYSGLNLRTKDYSMADVFSEADVCDVSTAFDLTATAGGTTKVTLPRYRSGITIAADTAPPQGLAAVLETMAGDYGWAGGLFRFRAGRMGTSAFAMDTSWLVQGVNDTGEPDGEAVITAVQALPREQRVNRVTGRCVDASQRYQMLPFPDVEDTVLIAAKGERPEEIDFAGCSHIAHAQHLGSIKIRQGQAGQRLEVRCGWQALNLELFDVGTITHPRSGMSAKTQEVRGWQWNPGGGPFKVKLAEITAAMFDVESPLTGRDPAPDSTLRRPWDVERIGALTVTSGTSELLDSGSIITRTKVAWPAVVGESVRQGGEIEVQYHDASIAVPEGDWPVWPEQGNSLFAVIPGLQTGRTYLFRARAVQRLPLVRGLWSDVKAHTVAAPPDANLYTLDLGIPGIVLAAAADGTVGSFAGATTTVRVLRSGIDATAGWTLSRVNGSGITSTFSAGVLSVTAMSADNAYIDVTATRTGYDDLTGRLTVAKSREGAEGDPGTPGNKVVRVYKRSGTTPTTPTGDGIPSGWTAAPPAADGTPLWMSESSQTYLDVLVGSWSAPVKQDSTPDPGPVDQVGTAAVFATSGSSTALGSLAFKSNGTITSVRNGGGAIVTANWYLPTTTSIGTTPGFWVKVTKESGNTLDGASSALDTWLAITSDRTYQLSRSSTAIARAVLSFLIASDSAGATIVGTGNLIIDVVRE